MRRLSSIALLAFVCLLLVGSTAAASAGASHPNAALPAPRAVTLPAGASPAYAVAPSHPAMVSSASAPPSPSSSAAPQAASCGGTPGGAYNWNTPNFFTDVATTFWTPGSPSLTGSNFQPVPCTNVIPTYTNGFWVNVSTNVPLTFAFVTIWGTSWPTPSNPSPDIKGFEPRTPSVLSMYVQPPFYRTASFFFNDYKNFWPGSTVYFNLTLQSTNATPSTIYSASPLSGKYHEAINFAGGTNNASWAFYVASPFSEQPVGLTAVNFSNVIGVSTSPTVLTSPTFDPNPMQTLQVYLNSLNFSGGPALAIPMAQATFTLTGGGIGSGVYYQNFGPANHSTMWLPTPIGPYPGTTVQFNVTSWLPWEGGGIDYIYSPVFKFNWSPNGGWWDPQGGLQHNLDVSFTPDLTLLGSNPTLATGTTVNITVHGPIQNVTIGSASVRYQYADKNGVATGTIPMTAVNQNTSFALIPGLPPGGGVIFSVVAKDIYNNAVSSGNWSYTESGTTDAILSPGYGVFYFEAVDLSTGLLVQNVNFTVANDTWSESSVGYPMGFANPIPVGGSGSLPVAFGTYAVTVRAFGGTQSWTGTVFDQNPFVVVFYVTSAPIGNSYSVPVPTFTIPAVIGLVGAAIASVPVANWFRERRRKAEAEQRRISL
ncbi:MAG TPA: hypothetical protein VIZ68_07965 [Thermoplasmata archaeon]